MTSIHPDELRIIFPYVELSKSFSYSNFVTPANKHQFLSSEIEKFFVSLHKDTASQFGQIGFLQSVVVMTYPVLVLILIVFGVLLGTTYDDSLNPFTVKFSLAMIIAVSALYCLLAVMVTIKLRKLKKTLMETIENMIQTANDRFVKRGIRWNLPSSDFPHWLELWIPHTERKQDQLSPNLLSPGTGLTNQKDMKSSLTNLDRPASPALSVSQGESTNLLGEKWERQRGDMKRKLGYGSKQKVEDEVEIIFQ